MSKSEKKLIVIVAPHPDDELISSYLILSEKDNNIAIVYSSNTDQIRRKEALNLKGEFDSVKSQFFTDSVPPMFLNPNTLFYFPDPTFEYHYDHRKWGAIGESLLRNGLDVIFYSINMQTPYCFEIKDFLKKKESLDRVYPSQKDLWTFDNKYFLFEGRVRWIMK